MNVVPQRELTWLNTHNTITTRVFASMANGRFGSSLLEAVSLSPPLTRRKIYCLFIAVHSLSHIWLFVTPWTAAHQVSLSFTISQSLPKFMSVESEMPSNHLIFCCPLLLLPSVFPSFSVFSSELALLKRWPKYWSFSIIPSNKCSVLISFIY